MTTKSIYTTTMDFKPSTYIAGPQLASMAPLLVVPGVGLQNNQSARVQSSHR
jgi:hypothetical protein